MEFPKNTFEHKQFKIEQFADLRGMDLSDKDLKDIPIEILMQSSFDEGAIWPPAEKLPDGFNPEMVLESGKNPGLGIRNLHEQGITGKGIHVGIIDQKLDTRHPEYAGNISHYIEIDQSLSKEKISMHGPGVASLLVGKGCGVAPESSLLYVASPAGDRSNWENQSQSLKKIIEYNQQTLDENKVKIVSCSLNYPNPAFKGDLNEWIATKREAEENGIMVIDAHFLFRSGFVGGGNPHENKDDGDGYERDLSFRDDVPSFLEGKIIIPSDYRTVASSWNKEGIYAFYGRGGISWAVPYLAGIFSLMLQVDNNLTKEEIIDIAEKTTSVNSSGLKIINPEGMVDFVRNR